MFRDPSAFKGSGWLFGYPEPRHQFVDAFLRPAIHQTRQQISEICLWIDAIQLTGLCRIPNYAERTCVLYERVLVALAPNANFLAMPLGIVSLA